MKRKIKKGDKKFTQVAILITPHNEAVNSLVRNTGIDKYIILGAAIDLLMEMDEKDRAFLPDYVRQQNTVKLEKMQIAE